LVNEYLYDDIDDTDNSNAIEFCEKYGINYDAMAKKVEDNYNLCRASFEFLKEKQPTVFLAISKESEIPTANTNNMGKMAEIYLDQVSIPKNTWHTIFELNLEPLLMLLCERKIYIDVMKEGLAKDTNFGVT
jgi:hypothetical protein